jgi:hypothetical protein
VHSCTHNTIWGYYTLYGADINPLHPNGIFLCNVERELGTAWIVRADAGILLESLIIVGKCLIYITTNTSPYQPKVRCFDAAVRAISSIGRAHA